MLALWEIQKRLSKRCRGECLIATEKSLFLGLMELGGGGNL